MRQHLLFIYILIVESRQTSIVVVDVLVLCEFLLLDGGTPRERKDRCDCCCHSARISSCVLAELGVCGKPSGAIYRRANHYRLDIGLKFVSTTGRPCSSSFHLFVRQQDVGSKHIFVEIRRRLCYKSPGFLDELALAYHMGRVHGVSLGACRNK